LACCCPTQCSFFEHREYKVVYRRYASLFFMVGVDEDEVSSRGICSGQSRGGSGIRTCRNR
jgi:hypothetical protein